MMGRDAVLRSFARRAAAADISVVEGNRGLYDGFEDGTHSTAELAKLLRAPVVLVLPVTKVTRTAAAAVLGFQKWDPELELSGVIINRVAGARHEAVVRKAIEEITGLRVLGALPRQPDELNLPGRHLGLVTPEEHPEKDSLAEMITRFVSAHVDIDAVRELATRAPDMEAPAGPAGEVGTEGSSKVRIGYFRDSAFTFYYQDNLEALESEGAELVPVSSIEDRSLADIDALYLGGGFPETHAGPLSANRHLMEAVRSAASNGLPIYAECGGLIFLARTMEVKGRRHPMAGVLPIDVVVEGRPQGHGYAEVQVDDRNPFLKEGTVLRGHEFHYSRVLKAEEGTRTAFKVLRGTGCFRGRDGIIQGNVLAGYTHLHAAGSPEWARGMVSAALSYHRSKVIV
jgi:cobyrinic acid a,c-diamide synthase